MYVNKRKEKTTMFKKPELEVVKFLAQDVLTASVVKDNVDTEEDEA